MSCVSSPILALDASTERCSVALANAASRYHRQCDTPRAHGRALLPMVDALLSAANLTLKDLTSVAVSLGPGSFTGIRIGLGIAQGLAFGSQRPLFACDSLSLLAQGMHRHFGAEGKLIISALDARMAEIYWAAHTVVQGKLDSLIAPRVDSVPDFNQGVAHLLATQSPQAVIAGGHGWRLDGVVRHDFDCHDEWLPHALDALDLLHVSTVMRRVDPMHVEPLYLRNQIAWEKRKRIRSPA